MIPQSCSFHHNNRLVSSFCAGYVLYMMLVTLKVLLFRYWYMLRQRWCLTVSYMSCPLVLLLLALWAFSKVPYHEYKGGAKVRSEPHLLRNSNFVGVEVVVCPDGEMERNLMGTLQGLLKRRSSRDRDLLNITFVNSTSHLKDLLVSAKSNITFGLYFHASQKYKFEYTIFPQAVKVAAINDDSADYRTREKFPSPMLRGPRKSSPYFESIVTRSPGVLSLQVAIDAAYIELEGLASRPRIKWALVSFPYPRFVELNRKYARGFTHRFILLLVQYILITGIIFLISVFASNIITDKMSGIREFLSLNGARRWVVNPSWLMFSCFEATILAIAEMAILKIPTDHGAMIQYMSSPVLTIVLIVYNVSSLCWVYFIATISTNQVLCLLAIVPYWGISPLLLELIPPDQFDLQAYLAPLPNVGMVLIFKSFQEFDGAQTVLSWNRLTTAPIHFLPVDKLMQIMLATSALLVLLSLYVDLIKPGPYGRARPWYLLTSSCSRDPFPSEGATNNNSMFPSESQKEDTVALECVGIYKFFGKNKAVIRVSLKIIKNQITVLFGRNGAGKTLLMSILSGMNSPTRGNLYTQEYNVFKRNNFRRFRKVLGYCPQNNILMNDLTFEQNLTTFITLKGLSRLEAEEYCNEWTKMFGMEKCRAMPVKYLSGGDRRKLTLAIALSGKPEFLLLDDPTSGLDPRSTRKFWNLLSQKKSNCTIFMSTYDLDNADIHGDRMIFMDKGELKAAASSTFLKKKLNVGYKVNCVIRENDVGKLIQFAMKANRSIKVLNILKRSVTLGLPPDFRPKDLPGFLRSLDSEFDGNISFEVSNVSTEDVLVKYMAQAQQANLDELSVRESDARTSSCLNVTEKLKIVMKWAISRMSMIVVIIILPAIGMVLAVYSTNQFLGRGNSSQLNPANLTFSMDKYSGTLAVIPTEKNHVYEHLRAAMNRSGIAYEEVNRQVYNFLGLLAKERLFEYRSRYVFSFGMVNETFVAFYSRNAFHSAPLAYSALINAILNGTADIVTHISPFVRQDERLACSFDNSLLAAMLFSTILGPVILVSGAYFIIFPHTERRTLFKQLQMMAGLMPALYWIPNLLFDAVIVFMTCILMISVIAIVDLNFFWDSKTMVVLLIVLLMYGISQIIFAYVWSFCRCSTPTVVTWYFSIILYILIAVLLVEFIAVFSPTDVVPSYKYLLFLPWVILMNSLWKISEWAALSRQCYVCNHIASCTEIWDVTLIGLLRRNLLAFLFISFAYFGFLLAMDHGLGRRLKQMITQACYGNIVGGSYCPEVAIERRMVRDLDAADEEDQPELVCDGLGKKYASKIVAVSDVTFMTKRGELLGLLGMNGAGRSTTFGMLAGVISPTKGTATIHGKWALTDFEYSYIRNIGYCPQFEGLLPELSGRETLRLFGQLRGLKELLLDSHVEKWLDALDMKSDADRPCKQYGEGNKKKLKFAIAMIVNPPVVLLDEPTSAVDSSTKIKIREILLHFSNQSKQAIVLTTHNFAECEAICDRVLILVNGEMKCIGSLPKLKNSMGKICTVEVKFAENTSPENFNTTQFKIEFTFTGLINLREKLHTLLIYNINTENLKVSDIYAIMLKLKKENPAIEDFSVTESSLEEVFVVHP